MIAARIVMLIIVLLISGDGVDTMTGTCFQMRIISQRAGRQPLRSVRLVLATI
jgi:hypothetical protein